MSAEAPNARAAGSLQDALLAPFRATRYRVLGEAAEVFDLRIDVAQPQFDDWLRRRGCACWAIVSAHNPQATLLSADENALRHGALAARLQALGWQHLPAVSIADAGDWPPEDAFLVLDASVERLSGLAAEFMQAAVVFAPTGEPPQLVWLAEGES
ncbi:DUF3293 domain-containing protein [Rhodocyclus tenuis]|uniref:DUF3293 domain-containing protein n=1 Tax=Rhodocyclus tenuis TaxID=1066 RepID=UPI001905E957|nr:DUF3293 domain-containing protein [Rhodocyclus tenuis]MBK1679169.1 hypothetical protein [Rhodocyclus tenuis]